jgi:hypothetical protein
MNKERKMQKKILFIGFTLMMTIALQLKAQEGTDKNFFVGKFRYWEKKS